MATQRIAKVLVLVGGLITFLVIPAVIIGLAFFAFAFAMAFAEDPSEASQEGGQVLLLIAGGVLVVVVGSLVVWVRALRGKRISQAIVTGEGVLAGWAMGTMLLNWASGDHGAEVMSVLAIAALGPMAMTAGALMLLVLPRRDRSPRERATAPPEREGPRVPPVTPALP